MGQTVEEYLAALPAPLDRKGEATPAHVVSRIRADLKIASKVGLLPPGVVLSITRRDYKSIRVSITAWPGQVLHAGYETWLRDAIKPDKPFDDRDEDPWHSTDRYLAFKSDWQNSRARAGCSSEVCDAVNAALRLIYSVANMHNYDNSDIQTDYFDVGYYLDVDAKSIVAVAEHGIRLEMDKQFAGLILRATDAAARLSPAYVESKAPHGVEYAGEWAMARLIEMDRKAQGRPVVYDKRGRCWRIDESAPIPQSDGISL